MPVTSLDIPRIDMPPLDLGNFNTPASMARGGLFGSSIPETSTGPVTSQVYTTAATRQAQTPVPVKSLGAVGSEDPPAGAACGDDGGRWRGAADELIKTE